MDKSKTAKELASDRVYYFIRIAVLLSVVFLFVPALNPSRICGLINKNLSLFTSGVAYSTLTADFGRAFRKGWVAKSSIQILYASSLAVCLGIAANAASGCMSLGNIKFKKLGNLISLVGSIVELAGMAGIYTAYGQVAATSKPKRVEPMFPGCFWLVAAVFALILAATVIQIVMMAKSKSEEKFEMETKFRLFLMFLPFIALVAVFSYLPLWGWRYAFFDYKVGDTLTMDKFVGFKWFTELVKNPKRFEEHSRNEFYRACHQLASHGVCHLSVRDEEYKIQEIRADLHYGSQLYQLGSGVCHCILYFFHGRFCQQPFSESGHLAGGTESPYGRFSHLV